MNDMALAIWLGAVGAVVGSFLNVVIYRLPRGKSIVSPPSHCPKCSNRIRWYDNLPIFGWMSLGGKCRDCKLPISFRYPLIEIIACVIVTTFACLLLPDEETIENIFVQIAWFSVLHLFLLTLGMIDFDRQSLKPLGLTLFLTPILIFGVFFQFDFSVWEPLLGILVALTVSFLESKIIRVNDRTLWLFAAIAVGGFLGWQMATVILLITLPCHAAIVFVTRRPCAVLSLAVMSFVINVWVLVQK